MKGTTPTKAQRYFHDSLVHMVGCICCRKLDMYNDYCSIHHIDGRTKPDAHWLVLPLCGEHHQLAPDSRHGNKAAFVARWGTEAQLLKNCRKILEECGYSGKLG